MTVRFYPGSKKQKTSLVAGFLDEFHVDHELVVADHLRTSAFHHVGLDPAVEVDGEMFVDPNVDALKKIFHVS